MRLPDWVKTTYPSQNVLALKKALRKKGLNTVCEEARCPNIEQCFSRPGAAFLILGPACTRRCGFCSVDSAAKPAPPNPEEPVLVALAAKEMGLKYVVVTSVTRDDLPDGGAGQFASTITQIKKTLPGAKVEVLTPDFGGNTDALKTVLGARPDVFNHNVETVPRLYPSVRPQADYARSISVLVRAHEFFMGGGPCRPEAPAIPVKSGFMLGLGERGEEVIRLMEDLYAAGVSMLTIGQYLRPTKKNLPVVEYIVPEKFEELKKTALEMGFRRVASGPLVRSSMNAEEYYFQ